MGYLTRAPNASVATFISLQKQLLSHRLHTEAYARLTELLKPENKAKIRSGRLLAYLEWLQKEQMLQRDTPDSQQLNRMEADLTERGFQLNKLEWTDEEAIFGFTG